jgi:hypothetical protein
MEPVWDTGRGSCNMVAVLDTNLVPKMGNFLPPSVNAAFLGTKMVPLMRHCFGTGIQTGKITHSSSFSGRLPMLQPN